MSNVTSTPDSQSVLNQFALEYLRQEKRKRVWRWVKGIVIVTVLIVAYFKFDSLFTSESVLATPHAGLIDINGTISDTDSSAENFAASLHAAYKNKELKALVLRINSPGGSPVQADYMFNSIQYYRKLHPTIKVYAVCTDMCASAAYYVAAAGDEIYANPSSMVGSIGVIYNGFGFDGTLEKVGVTRRLVTAGINKGFLDPFSPLNPAQVAILQTMLDEVHEQFIDKVKLGRGARLKIDDSIFSGLFWTGIQAKNKGLIDGFASSGQLIRDQLKLDKIVDYTVKPSLVDKFSKSIGATAVKSLPGVLGAIPGLRM